MVGTFEQQSYNTSSIEHEGEVLSCASFCLGQQKHRQGGGECGQEAAGSYTAAALRLAELEVSGLLQETQTASHRCQINPYSHLI